MIRIDESQFNALRIVHLLINADGSPHQRERAWFESLAAENQLNASQIAQLARDLSEPPPVAELFRLVTIEHDRVRLVRWLNYAMQLDGAIDRAEWRIYREVKTLIAENPTLPALHALWRGMAEGLLASHERSLLWRRLDALGQGLRQALRPSVRNWWRF